MKRLELKIGVAIVFIFGLLFAGMMLYEPVWFEVQGWRLKSDDNVKCNAALEAVGEKGERALPHIRKWLRSQNDRLVGASCLLLMGMQGDGWEAALPELVDILREVPSAQTDIAAAVIVDKNYACDFPSAFEAGVGSTYSKLGKASAVIRWKRFEGEVPVMRNICIYILSHEQSSGLRQRAAITLGEVGDRHAVAPLIAALKENDSATYTRGDAAWSLGKLRDNRAVPALIEALKNDSAAHVRWRAAIGLREIGDNRAVIPLISVLQNDSNKSVRIWACRSLGRHKDRRAFAQLFGELGSSPDSDMRRNAVLALGELGDNRAIRPLIAALENDSDSKVRSYAAIMLSCFEDARVDAALAAAREKGNAGAVLVHAWRTGGDALMPAIRLGIRDSYLMMFLADARVRWGDAHLIVKILEDYPHITIQRRFHADAFRRMPEGFPRYDVEADYATRKKQSEAIKRWYEANKESLRWDSSKGYRLQDEG